MKLICLGTAGYHPSEDRHTSCYFLPESGIILDAGTGIFRLPRHIQTEKLHIVLSHAHLDHVAGLTFLLDVLYQRPVDQLCIWGDAEKLDAIKEHLFADLIFPVHLDAQWCPIESGTEFHIGDCRIDCRDQNHPGGSLGFRLQWVGGKRLLYLSDTTGDTTSEAMDWYHDADLMMHECYFGAAMAQWAQKTGHTWTTRLGEIALGARPRRLLLTHANPLESDPESLRSEVLQVMRAQQEGGDVLWAVDGLELDF